VSLLLDTHVVLWWLTDDPALSDDIKTSSTMIRMSTSAPRPYGK